MWSGLSARRLPITSSSRRITISLPSGANDAAYTALPRDVQIVTYCTWPAEESSARAARILLDYGFKKVTPILGGFRAWQNADYPVETSP
mgnify:CR=1 FL=1